METGKGVHCFDDTNAALPEAASCGQPVQLETNKCGLEGSSVSGDMNDAPKSHEMPPNSVDEDFKEKLVAKQAS